MCGIFCEISYGPNSSKIHKDEQIQRRIKKRGPDSVGFLNFKVNDTISICFFGSVLWMQGKELTKQPVENEQGILLFNGDIFDETWNREIQSDTQILMDKLSKNGRADNIIFEIKKLIGPFSLLYYNKLTQCIYFTRDRIGRNTLLLHHSENDTVISSVLGRKYKCVEIPATDIYKLDVNTKMLIQYSWNNELQKSICLDNWLLSLCEDQNLPDANFSFEMKESVTFDMEDDVIKYIENISSTTDKYNILQEILYNRVLSATVKKLLYLLEKSVKIRLDSQPMQCKNCIIDNIEPCLHSATGILFSGGLDCTILAVLADKFVPKNQSIDLLNVSFESRKNTSYDVPDRLTGRQSYQELKKLSPLRNWIFREIDVPLEELERCQTKNIADLVYPRRTILDESLGSALWFAARGEDNSDISPCRVLLVGSGADELFGGYMRHRNALKRHGWLGLSKELLLDWKRISFRNLARDNRVMCDHGRQPRMPYLDEDFVNYVINLKPWLRCFPSANLDIGLGDKLTLRLIAFSLGLNNAATLPKRALQFGSRIANNKQKGSDISKRFEI